jgi:hypothetical protein
VQGVHSAYEPPITLQIPMATDDSPDDGTVESTGSKSNGSSPSSSHSDMSSPMFKPESLIVCIFYLYSKLIENSACILYLKHSIPI